jgi:hypothetical protein
MGPARAAGSTECAPAGCSRRSKRPRHQARSWDKASASICGGRGALSWRIDSAAKTAVCDCGPSAVEMHSAADEDELHSKKERQVVRCWVDASGDASRVWRTRLLSGAAAKRLARLKNAAGMRGARPSEGEKKFLSSLRLPTPHPSNLRILPCMGLNAVTALALPCPSSLSHLAARVHLDPKQTRNSTRASNQLPGCV